MYIEAYKPKYIVAKLVSEPFLKKQQQQICFAWLTQCAQVFMEDCFQDPQGNPNLQLQSPLYTMICASFYEPIFIHHML